MRSIYLLLTVFSFFVFADTPPPPPVRFIDSLVQSSRNVSLRNDNPSPGANQCYSTNSSGVLGWFTCTGGGGGGVSSVGLADGSTNPIYSITNSPVTSSGTLTLTLGTQTANKVFAGPSSGSASQPSFRSLVAADLPLVTLAKGGTSSDLSATGGTAQVLQQTSSGGAVTVGRLACASLSNGAASCSTDTTNASNISSGLLGIAEGGTNEGTQTSSGIMFYDGSHITSGIGFSYDGSLLSRLTSQLVIQSLGTGATNANVGTADTGATLVVGHVAGTSSIVSSAFGLGNAVFGDATGSGQVSVQGNGSIDAGYATGTGIVATELDASIAVGRADTAGQVSANGVATQAFGYADGGSITGASGSGSMVQGYSTGTSSTINTTSGKIGQIGGGYAATAGNISTAANGAISYGYADSTGTITASGDGGFAHGRSHGSGISLTASGIGSEASGYANSLSITASGNGSLAGGAPATAAVTASGTSAISWGDGNVGSGNLSLTTGLGNSNTTYGGIVGGRYASLSSQTATSWVASDFAIVYGNGTGSGAKSNAFSVTKNGIVTSSIFDSANGAVGGPAYSFTADGTSGMFLVGVGELGITVAGDQALDFQSDGVGDGNVGMGGPASLSPSYPLLIQRTNASAGTFIQVANPTASANANAAIQLSTDSNNLGNIGVYTTASTVAPYINAMIVRPNGDTGHLSLIGGDQTTGDVQVYTGGDYTSTGETAVFNGDHTTTLFGALKMNGSTSGTFTQKPAATTSSYSVTWPSAQGTGALTDNGSGVLSWTAYQTPLTFSDSLVNTAGTVTLVNDSAAPGNSMCYSTNSSGVLGWNACSSGGGSGTVTSITAGTGITLSPSPITTTGSVSLTVPVAIASGGTNSTSVTTAPAATAWAGWDANSNLSANNLLDGATSISSSGGTTTLTVASASTQIITGSTGQTIKLPVASTLALGTTYTIINTMTNAIPSVTIESSGANTICTLTGSSGATNWASATLTLVLTSGTTAASWLCTVNTSVFSGSNTTLTLGTGNGGTGKTSVTTAPAATAFAGWDANKNLSSNSFVDGYTTTATGATTTTLVVGSTQQQYFTGTTTQIVKLPVTGTLVLGQTFTIVNNSTGAVTVESSGANTLQVMTSGTVLTATVILTTGTTTTSWSWSYSSLNTVAPSTNYYAGFTTGATWSTASSTFADPTVSGTNTLTSRFSNGITVAAAATNGAGITFTPAASTSVYRITTSFQAFNDINADSCGFSLTDGTNQITTMGNQTYTVTGGAGTVPFTMDGIYAPGTGSAVTVKIQVATGGSGTCSLGQANVGGGSKILEWTVQQIL